MSKKTEQSGRGGKVAWAAMVLTAVLGLQAVAVQAAGGFSINPFTPSDGLVLNGDAALTPGGALRVTPAVGWQVGSAFYPYLVNVSAGFSTTFTFQITENSGLEGGGDGFAFLIQNDPSGARALGEGGGGLGYSGLYDALAVEFDTYNNTDWDPNANHVGLLASRTYLNSYHSDDGLALNDLSGLSITLMDGAVHTVTITYTPPPVLAVAARAPETDSPTGTFSVTLDGHLLFSKSIDLTVALALNHGSAYLGFSAGSGYAFENNDILSWSLDGQISSQSFYDDYCRSTLTVDPIGGYWSWTVLKGNGAGNTYTGMGTVVNGSGYIRITASPGQGMAMNFIDYTNAHRATATFTYRPDAVSSALYDSNTNLPPPCAEEGNVF